MLTLYHGTSDYALKRILHSGRFGVTKREYNDLVRAILEHFEVPREKADQYVARKQCHINSILGVTFYQNFYDSYIPEWETLGINLGEEYGNLIRDVLKFCSRVTGNTPYTQWLRHYFPMSRPVVLEVNIPESFIVNRDDIGSDRVLYSNGTINRFRINRVIPLPS